LSHKRKLSESGAEFRSHLDGSKHVFTPENVVDIQRIIGADITMAFDECPPGDANYEYAKQSMELTHRWLKRGIDQFESTKPLYGYNQAFFPIVQGAGYPDLRRQSAEYVASFNCAGNAIGGLAVGEPVEVMYEMIEAVNDVLPEEKPRYLMGVGTPVNILEAISRGVDMFDCVMPTRNGRNGMLFTREGIINIKNEKWKFDFSPLDLDGHCFIPVPICAIYLCLERCLDHKLPLFIIWHFICGWLHEPGKRYRKVLFLSGNRRWLNNWQGVCKFFSYFVVRFKSGAVLKKIDFYILTKFLGTFFFAILVILSSTSSYPFRLLPKFYTVFCEFVYSFVCFHSGYFFYFKNGVSNRDNCYSFKWG
jgi:hypothetical protein